MAKSAPSQRTVIADIPEVKSFKAEFFYNFFQPDERVNDSGLTTKEFVRERPTEAFDASFIESDKFNRFTARYVKFGWKPVIKETTFVSPGFKIGDNINKIYEEQNFIGDFFTNVTFQDTGIDEKMKYFVTRLAREQRNLDRAATRQSTNKQESQMDAAKAINVSTSDNVATGILTEALVDSTKSGFLFTDKKGRKIKNDTLLEGLKDVQFFAQINNKFLTSVLGTLKEHSFTVFGDEVENFISQIKSIEDSAKASNTSKVIDAADYEIQLADYVDYLLLGSGNTPESRFQVLGYFIEKVETTSDGERIVQDPIILENPTVNSVIDFKIKYGSTYTYTIRSIAMLEVVGEASALTIPESHDVAIRYLVASKPSHRIDVPCIEEVPPFTPNDFSVRWEAFNKGALLE